MDRTALPALARPVAALGALATLVAVAIAALVGPHVRAAPATDGASRPAAAAPTSPVLPTIVDDSALTHAVAAARERFLARQSFDRFDVAVLALDADGRWRRGAWGGERLALPASCVKLAYLVGAVHHCLAGGRTPDCLDADVRPMVVDSDNVATGRVVDALSDAPNVAWPDAERVPLPRDATDRPDARGVAPPPDFAPWLERRRYTEHVLERAGLLAGQTLLHKTWPTNSGDAPAGYERLALAVAGRNAMSPDGAARLMLALVEGALLPPAGADYARALLARDRWSGHATFGGGLPPGTRYAGKIGTAYDTLQEIAWFALPDGRRFVVAAFSNAWDADEPSPFDVAPLGSFVEDLLAQLPSPRPAPLPWATHAPARPAGAWRRVDARGAWRDGAAWGNAASGASYAWRVPVPRAGRYEVAVWYPAGADRTPAARYAIEGRDVPTWYDQRRWGGRWLPLGEVDARGRDVAVTVRADAPGLLVVDALRVTAVPEQATARASATARGTARTDPARRPAP